MKKIVLIILCFFGLFNSVNANPTIGPVVQPGYGYQAIFNTPNGYVFVRTGSLSQCIAQQNILRFKPGYSLVSSCRATIFDI